MSTDVASAPAAPEEPSQTAPQLRGSPEGAKKSREMVPSAERATSAQTQGSGELLHALNQLVGRGADDRDMGHRDLARALERVVDKLDSVHDTSRARSRGTAQILDAARRLDEAAKSQDQVTRQLVKNTERLRRSMV